jgi:tetratricopeptide (TPR) repeat protein
LLLANVALTHQRPESALESLETALSQDLELSKNPKLLFLKAKALKLLLKYEDAIELLQRVVDCQEGVLSPEERVQVFLDLAECLQHQKKFVRLIFISCRYFYSYLYFDLIGRR